MTDMYFEKYFRVLLLTLLMALGLNSEAAYEERQSCFIKVIRYVHKRHLEFVDNFPLYQKGVVFFTKHLISLGGTFYKSRLKKEIGDLEGQLKAYEQALTAGQINEWLREDLELMVKLYEEEVSLERREQIEAIKLFLSTGTLTDRAKTYLEYSRSRVNRDYKQLQRAYLNWQYGLTLNEVHAVEAYTKYFYKRMNAYLRLNNRQDEREDYMEFLVGRFETAILKLKKYKGYVTREIIGGITLDELNDIIVPKELGDLGFLSTWRKDTAVDLFEKYSTAIDPNEGVKPDWNKEAAGPYKVIFRIKSKSGRILDNSVSPQEDEVVFSHRSRFRVVSVNRNAKNRFVYLVELEEI